MHTNLHALTPSVSTSTYRDLPSKTELSSGSRLNQQGPVTDKHSDSAHVPCSDGTLSTPSCAGRYDMCYHQ
ncbi:hypothetical protein MHYP_G00204000 [Metynnis hypsauchen]